MKIQILQTQRSCSRCNGRRWIMTVKTIGNAKVRYVKDCPKYAEKAS